VFDDLKQGIDEIDTLADPGRGIVRVGTSEQTPAELVSAVIMLLSPRYPRLAFSVTQAATTPLQSRDLRERSVDLVFGRLSLDRAEDEDEDLSTEILFEDPYVVIAGEGSKWLRRRHVELDQLVDEPWFLNVSPVGTEVISAFHAKGLEAPRQIVTSNSNQLKHALVASGQFLSVTSTSRMRLSGKRLGLWPLKVDMGIPSSRIGLVTLKGRTISPAAQLFIDGARKITKRFANKDQ
jgi:DNA-binding transcriptional LysR family regulator